MEKDFDVKIRDYQTKMIEQHREEVKKLIQES